MATTPAIPLLLALLLLALIGAGSWSVLTHRRASARVTLLEATDSVLLVGLLLGAFAMGVFLAVALLLRNP